MFKKILTWSIVFILSSSFLIGVWIYYLAKDLPSVNNIRRYRPHKNNGSSYHWVPLPEISDNLKKTVIFSEDIKFYWHEGLDYEALWEAFKKDIREWEFAVGGSTITQQLAKNIYLSKDKTISRKIKEIIIARRIEEAFSKKRILELYLNEVEWGDEIYGAEAASLVYFNKSARDLSLPESALLTCMLPNPHYYSPYRNYARLKARSLNLLKRMYKAKKISEAEYEEAKITIQNFEPLRTYSLPSVSAYAD